MEPRRAVTFGLSAALVLCPLMAVAAVLPAAASCHDAPAEHDDATALACCASAVASAKADAEMHAPLAWFALDLAPRASAAPRELGSPQPPRASPPLFLRNASWRI